MYRRSSSYLGLSCTNRRNWFGLLIYNWFKAQSRWLGLPRRAFKPCPPADNNSQPFFGASILNTYLKPCWDVDCCHEWRTYQALPWLMIFLISALTQLDNRSLQKNCKTYVWVSRWKIGHCAITSGQNLLFEVSIFSI